MLRAALLLLVAANLLFFAWTRGWLDGVVGVRAQGEREPERLARQVRADQVVLLPADATPAAAGLSCVEAGPFTTAEAAAARAVLDPLLRGAALAEAPAPLPAAAPGTVLLRIERADAALATQLLALRSDALGRGVRRCGAAN